MFGSKLDKKHERKKTIINNITKKNKDLAKWGIDLRMVDLKENKSFSCMSAYYKFTLNDKITIIWFKEDINSNSPMYLCNLGNYFNRVREQIVYITFKSENGSDGDMMSFTGIDLGNDEPINEISAKMYSALNLKIIHDDYDSDVEYFRSLIHDINDVCKEAFTEASSRNLNYPGIDSSCWNLFD
jgi:hypothetical protein